MGVPGMKNTLSKFLILAIGFAGGYGVSLLSPRGEEPAVEVERDNSVAVPSVKEDGFVRNGDEIFISKAYRDHLLTEDFTKLLKDVKVNPLEGQNQGVRVSRIRQGSVFDKVGLENGDVIKEVNGSPIGAQSGATVHIMQFLKVRNGEELTFKISRGDETITKTIIVL